MLHKMLWASVAAGAVICALCERAAGSDHEGLDPTKPGERAFHVLKDLPMNPEAYHEEAAELVRAGIPDKFGHEEWDAIVLTHELHQHVGIMTVVGAKMAVRARKLLDAPPRAVRIVSETGPAPPLACAIDGLQVGLASTYAQQLIAAPEVYEPKLAATFEYKGHKIRLSLRPEYRKQVGECIQSAIRAHGNLTPAYFEQVEEFSYRVWADFDRKVIFKEETVFVPDK